MRKIIGFEWDEPTSNTATILVESVPVSIFGVRLGDIRYEQWWGDCTVWLNEATGKMAGTFDSGWFSAEWHYQLRQRTNRFRKIEAATKLPRVTLKGKDLL